MSLEGLLDVARADPALRDLLTGVGNADLTLTAPGALRPLALAALAGRVDGPVLAVVSTENEATELADELRCLLPGDSVAVYPAWETLPHERLSPRPDTVGRRLAVLRRMAHPDPSDPATGPLSVVVAPVRSVLQPQVAGLGDLEPVKLQVGDKTRELGEIVAALVAAGYARTELVERRGDIAVRGGILDVFPPTEEHPLRVEFWGDEVEEVRYFAVADQRSLGVAEHGLWAPPCRELLLTDDVRARALALSLEHPELAELLDPISEGTAVEGMESLSPVLVDNLDVLTSELPKGTHVVVCDPDKVRRRAADLVRTSEEFLAASWAAAAGGGQAPVDLGSASLRELDDVAAEARGDGVPWWTITPFEMDEETTSEATLVSSFTQAPDHRGDVPGLLGEVRQWLSQDWQVVAVFDGHGTADRAVERLREAELPVVRVESLTAAPQAGTVTVTTGQLAGGLMSDRLGVVLLTEADITGQRGVTSREGPRLPSRRRKALDPLQLQSGDLIVHEQHGVGRYIEMVRRTTNGGEREYLIIEYAAAKRGQPPDRLFVPTDALDQITRYVGGEAPTLNRLGGSDWAKTKGRARKAVKEIAAALIRLYSARMATQGHAFGPDTPWQRELEDAFPYVETPDQLAAIDEVKGDMEKPLPMDRVICGDVGYGKTEVAVRAAFKAVQDGKQVAILVPTTLLA
ncbi:MAG: CarD family transcriptional regulator, partial [Jatrophihabitans sp.]